VGKATVSAGASSGPIAERARQITISEQVNFLQPPTVAGVALTATATTPAQRQTVYDVRNYGPLTMGGTDDGTANAATIQAAINAASAAGGGVVFVPGGGNANKIRVTQVGMRAGVTLQGAGPGATVLRGTDSARHVIVIDETAGSVDQFVVEELKVEGGLDGLHFAHSNNANQLSFARGVIRNVIAVGCASTGFYLDTGCLEYRLENCHAKSCGIDGFRYQSTDHFAVNCTAQASGFFGFRVNGANNRFANCKAFGGQRGWVVAANRHTFAGCEAQENSGDGFWLDGADHTLSGCLADSNGGVGFNVITADNHTLTGCHSTSTPGLAFAHAAGFGVAAGGNRRVRITGCSSRDASALSAGSVTAGCSVDIDGSGFAPKVYATAARPPAASVGVGAQVYDSTLSRPIWSDGSIWRDAAGSVV
jgi:polygalacturonase